MIGHKFLCRIIQPSKIESICIDESLEDSVSLEVDNKIELMKK